MINIIIVDADYPILFNYFSKNPSLFSKLNIIAVCVRQTVTKEAILSNYPTLTVYDSYEITNWDSTYLSQEEITQYRSTQLKIEKFYARYSKEAFNMSYLYYNSLAFWLNIFNNHNIDSIIIYDYEHGTPTDSIPLEIAKRNGVTALTLEPAYLFSGSNDLIAAVHCYNSNQYVNLSDLGAYDTSKNICKSISEKNGIKSQKKQNNMFIYFNKIASMIQLLPKYLDSRHKYQYMFGIKRNYNLTKCIGNIIFIYKLKKDYLRYSTDIIANNEKYVLYALHFEPEASIMNRTIYNNQIYNIKMLSKSIPRGWTLYIKEHPHQFNYSIIKHGFIDQNLSQYRNKSYYSELIKLPNVKLLDYRISASLLLTNNKDKKSSQKINGNLQAVVTINGTIALECMQHQVPLILFDSNSALYMKIPEVFNVKSMKDLMDTFDVISKLNGYIDYGDYISIVNQYLVKIIDKKELELPETIMEKILLPQ